MLKAFCSYKHKILNSYIKRYIKSASHCFYENPISIKFVSSHGNFLAFVLVAVILCHQNYGTPVSFISHWLSLLAIIPIQFSYEQDPYSTSLLDHFAFPCESEQLSSPSLWRVCVNDVSRMWGVCDIF